MYESEVGLQPLPVLSERQQVSLKMWSTVEPQRQECLCADVCVRVSEKSGARSHVITKSV